MKDEKLIRKESVDEALELMGIKKGAKVSIKCGRRTFMGVVKLVTPSFIMIETNPEKKTALLRINRITWIEIIEENKK